MTIKRNDLVWISGSWYQPANLFLLEIRNVSFLDSKRDAISIMDIDAVIRNYRNGKYLFIENKAFEQDLTFAEQQTVQSLADDISGSHFIGFFRVQHENKGPSDGYTRLAYFHTGSREWMMIPSASKYELTSNDLWHFVKGALLD